MLRGRGWGDLEIVNPDLSAALVQAKIEEVKATGTRPGDLRLSAAHPHHPEHSQGKKIPLAAMDITEFVLKNMDG